jgi:hypothetical protein
MVASTVGLAPPYSYVELLDRVMDDLPGLVLPRHGRWRVVDTRPLALDACEDISCFRTCPLTFTRRCGFLPRSLNPAWVGATADVRIPLIESLSFSVMRWVFSPRYMLSGMLASLFVRY